jgi:hypothetical protein
MQYNLLREASNKDMISEYLRATNKHLNELGESTDGLSAIRRKVVTSSTNEEAKEDYKQTVLELLIEYEE